MAEEALKETENSKESDKPWLFKKGQSGNPGGRPKGKSLKDYTREMLASMTDDERQEYLKGIPKEIIWKMAEGNPRQDTDITTAGRPIVLLANEILEKNGITPSSESDSEGHTQI